MTAPVHPSSSARSTRRLGWLGGTFDPIHLGHLDVARAARAALHLDEVALVPAHHPPHRDPPVAAATARLAMVRLAAATEPWLTVSELELHSDAPSYTMTTLDRLEAAGVDLRALYVITGADAFADIATWKGYPALLDRCHFVVVSRPGHHARDLRDRLPALAARLFTPGESGDRGQPVIFLVDAATAPVSSTGIRAAAAAGTTLTGLVPDAVASYIGTHGLYRGVE